MEIPTCIKCSKQTKSVLDTEEGPLCFPCYSECKSPVKAKKVISHEEADIQKEFFNNLRIFFPSIPDKLVFAVPNGGSRDPREAKNMKMQGVKAGVADVILLIPKKGFASLCMEFKTEKGKQSDEQKEFQIQAEKCGNKYVIVRSVQHAIETVKEYLK